MHDIVGSLKICSWMQDQSILLSADVTGGYYEHLSNEPCPGPWTMSNCAGFENTVQKSLPQRYVQDGIFLPVIFLFISGILTSSNIAELLQQTVKIASSECVDALWHTHCYCCGGLYLKHCVSASHSSPGNGISNLSKPQWECGSHWLVSRSPFAAMI